MNDTGDTRLLPGTTLASNDQADSISFSDAMTAYTRGDVQTASHKPKASGLASICEEPRDFNLGSDGSTVTHGADVDADQGGMSTLQNTPHKSPSKTFEEGPKAEAAETEVATAASSPTSRKVVRWLREFQKYSKENPCTAFTVVSLSMFAVGAVIVEGILAPRSRKDNPQAQVSGFLSSGANSTGLPSTSEQSLTSSYQDSPPAPTSDIQVASASETQATLTTGQQQLSATTYGFEPTAISQDRRVYHDIPVSTTGSVDHAWDSHSLYLD